MIELREVLPSDVEILARHQDDREACAQAALPWRDLDASRAHWREILSDPNVSARLIVSDGSPVGHVLAYRLCEAPAVGYWVERRFWGRGLATAGLRLLLAEVTVRPLYARVSEHNGASMRVLEKCGFRSTGQQLAGNGITEFLFELNAQTRV